MNVKLSDIAKKLNVSTPLISIVLNGKGQENRISAEMCKKVTETAREMGYRPNQMARGLRTGKSRMIGLIVADIANPFFSKIAREIENEAWKEGYQVVVGSSDENMVKSLKLIQTFIERRFEGLIIAPVSGIADKIKQLTEEKVPFVLIDRCLPGIDSNCVLADNYSGSFELVNRLIDKGFKRIGVIVVSSELMHMSERVRGYTDALKNAGIAYDPELIYNVVFENFDADLSESLTRLLTPEMNVDALYFTNNKLALKGLEILSGLTGKMPKDLSIACFDNSDAFKICSIPITRMEQPVEVIGKTALELLISLIDDQSKNLSNKPKNIVLATKFISG